MNRGMSFTCYYYVYVDSCEENITCIARHEKRIEKQLILNIIL
ncbi:hypothetical protein M2451_003853 [Dysgonomonas sp. PFB1-18]|nr:hypothetical protein [Dysgonomonas sp. PF1-14]MDH6340875.1 hypothetical protein [Dysgonomonas sp. PF1-16]MDH6382512.1 hypothetical protein [Dysgonomonas sp. PFB1-18]MDH6399844.1 hypothetical protein [Dysgonomonas sp. PF1-23]